MEEGSSSKGRGTLGSKIPEFEGFEVAIHVFMAQISESMQKLHTKVDNVATQLLFVETKLQEMKKEISLKKNGKQKKKKKRKRKKKRKKMKMKVRKKKKLSKSNRISNKMLINKNKKRKLLSKKNKTKRKVTKKTRLSLNPILLLLCLTKWAMSTH